MNYTESLAYLDSLGKFGIKLGMERIEGLLRELGNPEQKIKTVHVTGTNGKGSVTSMITNILLAANLKVGKFTSPHLVKYNERINLNGKDISDEDFATAITAVKVAADSVVKKGVCEQPTQFEILTAAAFLYFYLQKVDYAVIEVGMGGLWDSTNVITPVVSVITTLRWTIPTAAAKPWSALLCKRQVLSRRRCLWLLRPRANEARWSYCKPGYV